MYDMIIIIVIIVDSGANGLSWTIEIHIHCLIENMIAVLSRPEAAAAATSYTTTSTSIHSYSSEREQQN